MTCMFCGFVTPYWTVCCNCPRCGGYIDVDDVPEES